MPELYQIYAGAARSLGATPAPLSGTGPAFAHVPEDPEAAWHLIAPHAMHEMNAYARYAVASNTANTYVRVSSLEEIKASGGYAVVTPGQTY